jgi:dipeptidyl aminopeptidase/acylaminoacyl peptidase
MPDLPTWEARFRAPILSFPAWSPDAPDRLALASTESGSYQLYAWDRATGRRRQVTHDPVGVLGGRPTRDGTGIAWFHDATGAESGGWVVAPFDTDDVPLPLITGVPEGWNEGLSIGRRRIVAAVSTADRFAIWASEDGGEARCLHAHPEMLGLGADDDGALSADESMLVFEHAEDGDVHHTALRAIDASSGATIADLRWEGVAIYSHGFSPVAGDPRVAIAHERSGQRRPALWDVRTGEVRDLPTDLVGDLEVAAWWPDGSALLLLQMIEGRHALHRHDIAAGTTTRLASEPGSITAAAVRPDGAVWYRCHNGEHPAQLLEVGRDGALLEPDGPRAPAGRPFESWHFANPHGQPVHGFVVRPAGDGPYPVIVRVHGGPHMLDMDRWVPDILAHVEAGFLVAMVNYRGSDGYGQAWRDALIGNVGFLELEDVLAGVDDLVDRGLADPARVVLAGWSWGGYVTLLGAGRHPDRWISLVAGVPVADYVAAFEDEAPSLQALDRALFGGDPTTEPDLYVERSPITYVDAVEAPLLILAGENDSRCPIRQIWNYVGRMRERGMEPQVYTYATGHASFDTAEKLRQAAIVLDFLARTVPGVMRLEGVDAHLPAEAAERAVSPA